MRRARGGPATQRQMTRLAPRTPPRKRVVISKLVGRCHVSIRENIHVRATLEQRCRGVEHLAVACMSGCGAPVATSAVLRPGTVPSVRGGVCRDARAPHLSLIHI